MRYPKILLDLEVQKDFFAPGGSCYSDRSAEAARNVRKLFAWVRRENIPVISTMLRVPAAHKGPLAPVPHCVEYTEGEQRLPGALAKRYIDLGIRGSTDLPRDIFTQYQQVVFEKRYTDIFLHVRAERLLTELRADTFIICGAGSARGIVEAVVGLRHRGFNVVLAADAILDLDDPNAEMAWLRMLAKGAIPLSTEELMLPGPPPRLRDKLAEQRVLATRPFVRRSSALAR